MGRTASCHFGRGHDANLTAAGKEFRRIIAVAIAGRAIKDLVFRNDPQMKGGFFSLSCRKIMALFRSRNQARNRLKGLLTNQIKRKMGRSEWLGRAQEKSRKALQSRLAERALFYQNCRAWRAV